ANNKISHIIGFEKVPYLLKINLEGNGLPYEKGYNKNGQVLVDYCSGIPFKEAVEKYKVKATVVKVLPFVHPILQYDTKDRCIYCGSKTIFNQENINKCSEHLKKIIIKANERLPGLKTKKKLQIKPSERTVTTFDIRYGTTRVERPLAVKIDKKYLSVDKFYGSIYPSLAGTFCNKCSTDFLESAERIFNNVKTRGKYEAISASVGEAINNYSKLLTTWENKIIKK
ncbi:MAG: hypothetical protein ACFFC1_21880, partial [Promethearchaeota archaeon]